MPESPLQPKSTSAVELSVVIPTLGRETLSAQLASLEACSRERRWNVIVADNSHDRAARAICERKSTLDIRWVDAHEKTGRSYAANVGAAEAAGRYLLFLDDDDTVEESIVSAVLKAFDRGVQAVVFNFEVASINPEWLYRAYDFEQWTTQRPMFRDIPAFWGCAAIERSLFLDLGGFDEMLPYAEDLAFSVALHRRGIEPFWIQERLLNYRLRPTLRGAFRRRVAIVSALDLIAHAQPDIVTPSSAARSRIARSGLSSLVRHGSRVLSRTGRIQLADELGALWARWNLQGSPR